MPAVASYAPRGQATRNSNRQRPQRVQIFRNDNWPPRPPALDLPVPSFLTPQSPDSDTSLLRGLPTPSFVTPADFSDAAMDIERMVETNNNSNNAKTAPPPVPTKAVIAASAVPLADWFADVVWAIYLGRNSTVATTGGNAGLAGADKAPPALAAFVHAVLSQTLASPQCAALGLYYLVRLPVNLSSVSNLRMGGALWNVGPDAEGHTCYASVPDRERAARAGFVAELYGQGVGPGGEDVPYRLAALALMLGNKWLDDHTFTNKTWHEVTHLPLACLTALEQRALECFNHTLGVADADWRSWLGVLRDEATHAGAAIVAGGEAVGVSALAVDTMERLEREREVLVYGVGAGVLSTGGKGVIGDRRGSFGSGQVQTHVPPVSEMELDELEMEQVEIDIDLDDGGPVPEELRRPVKVRLGTGAGVVGEGRGAGGWVAGEKYMPEGRMEKKTGEKRSAVGDGRSVERVDEWERAVKASANEHWLAGLLEEDDEHDEWTWAREDGWLQWDRERDPPVERVTAARGGYEAVQRPGKKQLFVDEDEIRVKGKKELFAVGAEYRGGKSAGASVPRVELYDAQLQDVRAGAGGYEHYGQAGYEHYMYDYPTKGAYHPSAYEAIPRDAMGYDSGLAYTHGYDCLGYEYAGQCYGGSYVPRQVPVPVWVPQQQPAQHRGSNGCILS
ncbi:hypothetical protein FRC10_004522 [Ceratobasidium sp. 414]|nr:hypothetical protein FRC10_004522 [Ceratobasidium sp. 414]